MGKKKNAITMKESHSYRTVNGSVTARNLRKSDLCGVIFGCTHKTIKECFANNLFGLPDGHFSYVSKIEPGLPLFLFSYSDRKLHGVFEAASKGRMHINPFGWSENSTESTPFGAQVRIRRQHHCQPLVEEVYKPIIADNYFEEGHFWNELDREQTNGLIQLFLSSPAIGYSSSLRSALSSQLNLERKGSSSVALATAVEGSSSGRSYSSVVKKTDNSFPQTQPQADYSNTGWDNAWTGLGSGTNIEATKKNDQDGMNWKTDNELTSFSAVEHATTSIPQMKWSSLFKTSPADGTNNNNEDIENANLDQEGYPEEDIPQWRPSSEEDSPRRAPSPAPVPAPGPVPYIPSAEFDSPPQSGFFSTIPPPHLDSTPPMMHMYKAFSQSTYEVQQAMDFLIVALLRQDEYLTQLCQNVTSLRDEFRASRDAAPAGDDGDEDDA